MKKFTGSFIAFLIASMLSVSLAMANNVALTNASLLSQDTSLQTMKVQFDLSWDNSWRDSINHDAVWVFLKYSIDSGTTWHHGTLKTAGTNPSNFSTGSGSTIQIVVPEDRLGCFISRVSNGSGQVSTQSVQLVWDYGTDGVSDYAANAITTKMKVYGIEMVYIPQGAFLAGEYDGDMNGCVKGGATRDVPVSISSENALSFNAEDAGPYYYQSAYNTGEFVSGAVFTVPPAWPKGYNAFYLMKYEISQGQWIDFFNTLTDTQKANRDITSSGAGGKGSDDVVNRNAVSWTSGIALLANFREFDRACNYLSWTDFCAFADWAALRPMTEFEFEKACRGTTSAVNNEFAWGNSSATAATTFSGTENGTETVTNSGANCAFNSVTFSGGDGGTGPVRCGIFAKSNSTRVSSGAGFYGNMELSGNLWERAVSLGNSSGLVFIGSHGDGMLTDSGNATNSDWPGIDSDISEGITGAAGAGFLGGSWDLTDSTKLTIADRSWAALENGNRDAAFGGRCSRTAP